MVSTKRKILACLVVLTAIFPMGGAHAETIFEAMTKAYANNPDLNAARASLRATDEGVAIAKSVYRPRVFGSSTLSSTRTDASPFGSGGDGNFRTFNTADIGLTVTQVLFDGFTGLNQIRAANSNVFSTREQLRDVENNTLLAAAQAYSNLARDQEIVEFREQNIAFLREQLSAAEARFEVGEGTRTDVSQAEAELAAAQASLADALAAQRSSEAVYIQIVGTMPVNISQPGPITRPLPTSLNQAIAIGMREHPLILASRYDVDAAQFQVKAVEGTFLPGVQLQGSIFEEDAGLTTGDIRAQITIPLYQGGEASARVRQNKELLGQARILVDTAQRGVEQVIVTSWSQYQASLAAITANEAQVRAANLALQGVIEERNVGQRTTLDVLDAQQTVLNARESLAQSQRNAVVASYTILAALGRLTVNRVGLQVAEYRPEENFEAVKDKWYGLRTVDGR